MATRKFLHHPATLILTKHWSGQGQLAGTPATVWDQPGQQQIRRVTTVQPEVKPFSEIPGPGGLQRIPVLGTILKYKPFTEFTSDKTQDVIHKLLDEYGPIVYTHLGSEMILLSDPKDFETVSRNEGKYPQRFSGILSKVYCKRNNVKLSLADLDGEEWQKLRSPVNKRLMRVGSALHYIGQQDLVTDCFVKILATQKLDAQQLSDWFFRYAAEAIGVVCYNTRVGLFDPQKQNDPKTKAFFEASKDIFMHLNKTFTGESILHGVYRNKTYLSYEQDANTVKQIAREYTLESKRVLEERKKEGKFDADEPNLLNSLLNDNSLEVEDIVNIIESLYNAGTDSTAKNIQAIFYHLAVNPEKQEKLREEVRSILGKDKPMTAEAYNKMPYLKACQKESFRLTFPAITGPPRTLQQDAVLSGYHIPAGTKVFMCSSYACQKLFKDSDKFLPERWIRSSDGQKQEEVHSMTFIPFGHGPRNCVGKRFAEQEIHLCSAKVVQKLNISVSPESLNTKFVYHIFPLPEKPIAFSFTEAP